MHTHFTRRQFLRSAFLCGVGAALAACAPAVSQTPAARPASTPASTLILYDSVYGNTEKIALAAGQALGLDHARIKRVTEANPLDLAGVNLLLVGSPTHAFSALESVTAFIRDLPEGALSQVRTAAFDTHYSQAAFDQSPAVLRTAAGWFGNAAEKLARQLAGRGALSAVEFAGFTVEGSQGPLSGGELERAARWAQSLLG
ncbi:MAG: flavodoxin family protein [Anaerolineae bacterium]